MSANKYDVKLHVVLPLPNHGYNRVDSYNDVDDIEENLRGIENRLLVKIEQSNDGNSLTIQAFNKAKAKEAVTAIQKLLIKKKDERSILWCTKALVASMDTDEGPSLAVFLLQKDENESTLRPVAPKILSSSGLVDTSLCAAAFRDAFKDATDHSFSALSRVSNKMRMRVHFGTLALRERKKGKSEYTKPELQSLLSSAGTRGTAKLNRRLDIDLVHDALRNKLSSLETKVLPLRANPASVTEIAPTYSVALMTADFEVESLIETSTKGGVVQATGMAPSEFCFSPFQVCHRFKQERTMDITASCPRRHDWSLAVESYIAANELARAVPFTQQTLQKAAMWGKGLRHGFPAFQLRKDFVSANKITHIIGCVTWTYHIDAKYSVDVTCYYKWDTDMSKEPIQGWTMSLYSSDWDDVMQEENLASGPRDWKNFADTFLQAQGDGGNGEKAVAVDKYADFFSKIQRMQAILEEAKELERACLERKKHEETADWLGLKW
ncbi:hypothetical protein B0T14DRAFT_47314 [Immersiella caudata]|uniref:Uncharacterized protein n=1 Tax=Immersiella caudata TaxID=314043 RepID=A0AA40CD01_9PEZI|nr:hypothetical protein B0T14DRAFT_47314 [Immersiella caudata]